MSRNRGESLEEILDVQKCPNCERYSYVDGTCEYCGIGNGDLYTERLREEYVNFVPEYIEKVLEKKTKNIRSTFTEGKFTSYKISKDENNKIKSIKFKLGEEKEKKEFKIEIIDYNFTKEDHNIEYGEKYTIVIIKNLHIGRIQKKVKVGYGEIKNSLRGCGVLSLNGESDRDCRIFIERLLQSHHNK